MDDAQRKEMFERAKAARKAEREKEAEKKAGGGSNFQYEDVQWSALMQDQYKTLRLLGNPIDQRQSDPYSPKVVWRSTIIADGGKQMKINWPSREENSSWILWKIYDKVMSYKWDKEANERVYFYKKTHSDVFNRVFKNGKPENTYEPGWKPKQVVLINTIDRDKMDWHRENKHTALLSKKVGEGNDGAFFYEFGIPYQLYTTIFDDIVSYAGDWESYDIFIRKYEDDPYYKVYHAVDDMKKLVDEKHLIKGTLDFVDAPLSDEEKSWARYDIDKYSKIASYQKIMKGLGVFIQQVDATFKTNFYFELEGLVEKEKAERKEAEVEEIEEDTSEPVVDETHASVPTRSAPPRPSSPVMIDWASIEAKGFKGISLMTAEEKKAVLAFDGENFQYDPSAGNCLGCCNTEEECSFATPNSFAHCPKCGIKFPEE